MKIGLVVPGGVDRSGERRVIPCLLWFIERLARRHEVHVVALYQEPEAARYELLGAVVHNIGMGRTRRRAVRCILAEHRASPFDVLHAFWAGASGFVAACAGALLRRPVVVHLGGGELVALGDIAYGGGLSMRGRVQVRLALSRARCVTAASGAMVEAAAKRGIAGIVVPLGVDLVRWPPRDPRPRSAPARLLHVASLNHVKEQRVLLEAAALLAADGVAFHLDIIGEDTVGGRIHEVARSLGLSSRVSFHGFLPHQRLRPFFDAAHLLLLSSRHEAGPVVVLEAAVAGVPTVGTAVGHVRDFAPHAAVAVGVGDTRALARETTALLADDSRRLAIAREAQRRAVEQDADWTAARFQEIYDEVIANR